MRRFFWLSRSPSPSALSALSKISEQQVQRDYDRKTRRHWKEIFASFILIASFVTVIVFIMGLNLKLMSGRKPYQGSRQRGPFGLPETTTLVSVENGEDTTEVREMPVDQEAADTGTDGGPEEWTGDDVPRRPTYPHVEITDEPEYESEKLRAPGLGQGGDKRAKCNTSLCWRLKEWFQKAVARQADPCKERNTFVCDAAVPFPGFKPPLAKAPRVARSKAGRGHSTAKPQLLQQGSNEAGSAILLKSCLQYAREPNANVDDILLFLSHLNLDMRRMVDDPAEDPLTRMMELSLEYGVDAPVSFVRRYDVAGEARAPYLVQITLNPEVGDFFNAFRSLEEEEVLAFYQFFVRTYALLKDNVVAEQLVNADDELSDFLNKTQVSSLPSTIAISKLAEATGVTAGRWKELLASFGRTSGAMYEEVIADEQALTFVAYLLRPFERLAMRRVLAWHVLRYMMGPKADILKAANQTQDEEHFLRAQAFQPSDPHKKCTAAVDRLKGVRYAALSLLEGDRAVPNAAIVNVTRFMAEFQEAMASVFRKPAKNRSDLSGEENGTVSAAPADAKASQVALFPLNEPGRGADSASLFAALDGGNESIWEDPAASTHSFTFRWLRHLRAWYALPPLLQALLPRMVAVAHVETPAAFFRPPYYHANAPPEYNFAVLGQVIGQAMAHELADRRRVDPAIGERWRAFWQGVDTANGNSVYCLRTGIAKNVTWQEKRLDESKLTDRDRLDGVLGSRIAYLAYLRAQRRNATATGLAERLPGVDLPSKQLFFVMHCALSCVMGRGPDSVPGPAGQRCMVAYRTRKRSAVRPCRQSAGRSAPNECHYI